jgi:predicted ATPase/class 3 adenylate cyclase
MPHLPTGTVTFLFTDIEGSTRLLQRLGDAFHAVIDEHGRILREAIASGAGTEVHTEGDSFFASFPTPLGALRAAVHAQRALAAHPWPEEQAVGVRMGLHTGEGVLGGDDYIGLDVHRAARISAAGHGGQVLISEATRALVEDALPEGVALRDLGRHRLKDLEHPEHLHQLVIDGLPADFPPIRSRDARLTNLPSERTSFVGREREMGEVTELLERTRLLTLTGPGGTGKTRLALRVAAENLDRFADGVFLTELSSITDPALVPSAVAEALRMREQPGRGITDSLSDHLGERELLLVLDNFEQVAPAASVVARLLDAASRLKVLVTSRVPLHISGEQEYRVPPMALPDPGQPPDLATLTGYESVALFIERATAVRPGFLVTDANASALAEITARLDGLPLAIELAASRLKLLTPETLLNRLERRLPLLTGGPRDVPERQRTLRRAIEWSEDLLNPDERALFTRLSVFVGGWNLESAEAVCGPGLGVDVLEGLGVLMDASLVRQVPDGEARFTMLETIGEYATGRLIQSGEEQEVRRRHAEHFRDLAEQSDPGFFHRVAGAGKEQGAHVERLDQEHDNVRAALEWAIAASDVVTGLRTAAAMSWFWQHRGHFSEGRGWLERLLPLPGAASPDSVRGRSLLALGDMAYWQSDYGPVRSAYEEAGEIARAADEPRLLAWSLLNIADLPFVEEDYERAEVLLTEGLAAAEEAGDRSLAAEIRAVLARNDWYDRDDPAAALEPIREAIAIHRDTGAPRLVAINLNRLGFIELLLGELDAAQEHLRESLGMITEAGSVVTNWVILRGLAEIASRRAQHRRAARLIGAVARIRDEVWGGGSPQQIPQMPAWGDAEAEARRALGEDAFEHARAEGYAMSRLEAVAYAGGDGE